ncbi:MAG: YtxH domain-containing protein [Bryobacteraceae bacterium]
MDESKGLSYFMLGLGIGVAVGIVFAPQSGEDTRGLIRSKALESGDYVKRQSESLRGSAEELVEKGKTAIKTQKEQLSAAVDAGKQAYRESVATATDGKSTEAV